MAWLGQQYRGKRFGGTANCACHSRRSVLAGISAVGVAGLWSAAAQGQVASPAVRAIDVHHHLFPPRYRTDAYERLVKEVGPGLAPISLKWTPDSALERMDQAGVATAINSISTPGVWFEDGQAGRARARECNDYGAQLMRDFPGRFGMFAAIPLPDTEGSLREIEYAFDVLKLDGVGVLTSYAGKLLGNAAFTPVFEELNRRQSVVFVHPTSSCCSNPIPDVGATIIEFPMDTTRTITSLLVSGAFARHSDIRFIFSHGGGMLVSVVNRIVSAAARMKPEQRAVRLPNGPEYELQRQYYDLASVGFNPAAIAGLRKFLPMSQLLYGSDEPFNSTVGIDKSLQKIDFTVDEFQAFRRGNAVRLFPRLA
jgi:6-methylsalicylate decarboxylase